MLLLLGAHVGAPHSSEREMIHSGCKSLLFGFPKRYHSHLIPFPRRVTEIGDKTRNEEPFNDCANNKQKERL